MTLTALSLLFVSAAPDAALLERLAAHAERMEKYARNASLTVDVVAEEYDSDGKVSKTTKSSMQGSAEVAPLRRERR